MIPEEDPLLGNRTLFLLIVIELVLIFLVSIFEFYWDVLGFQLISFPSLGFFYFLSVEKWKTSKPISFFLKTRTPSENFQSEQLTKSISGVPFELDIFM